MKSMCSDEKITVRALAIANVSKASKKVPKPRMIMIRR